MYLGGGGGGRWKWGRWRWGTRVAAAKLHQEQVDRECSDLPPEHQPPRGARREFGDRPLSTANDAGAEIR